MKLKNVIIGCAIILIIACIGGGAALYFGGKAVVDTLAAPMLASNDFMTAVTAKDYTKAYGLILPSQQSAYGGSADGFQQWLTDKQWIPSSFAVTNISISSGTTVNGTGVFGGSTKYVYLTLAKDGDAWKISSWDVSDNAPTATPPAS